VYKLINFYTQRFSFPHRGWKYFRRLLKTWDIEKREYRKKISNGMFMLLTPSEHIQQQLFWYGYYEEPVALLLEHITEPNSIVLDIGANVGYFTLIAAKKAKTGKIFSFEPVSELCEQLRKNIEENKLNNVEINRLAVGEHNQDAVIFLSGSDNQGMSSLRPPENFAGISQPIRTIRIDNWAIENNIKKIDVIKLDIEGSELSALKGMDQTLNKLKPMIIVELNPDTLGYFDLLPSDVLVYLRNKNYIPFEINERGSLRQANSTHLNGNIAFIHRDKLSEFSLGIR
jgi:FkbM family methyltransferase